jgi:HlyD family secretion protein
MITNPANSKSAAPAQPAVRKNGRFLFQGLLLPTLAAATLAYTVWHVARTSHANPRAVLAVEPPQAAFARVVAGVGLIEPRSENVEVAAPVPGIVVEVAAHVGEELMAGDMLFRLDDRQQRASLAVQEAQLAEAQAMLRRLEQLPQVEGVPPREARGRPFEADSAVCAVRRRRVRQAAPGNVTPAQKLVAREQASRATPAAPPPATADDTRLRASAREADLAVARAQVARAERRVDQAQQELDRLVVRAPMAGTVLKVDVRPGEFVGTPPGKPIIVLGDLSTLHVRVDIDEQDLARFTPGMTGQGFVRGDARMPLALSFVRVEPLTQPKRSLTGAGDERIDTRVLQVIYAIESTPRTVYVGQQIEVFLDADSRAREADVDAPRVAIENAAVDPLPIR